MKKTLVLLFAVLSLSFLAAMADEIPTSQMAPVTLSQAVDILDSTTMPYLPSQKEYMTKEHLRERVKKAYDEGIRKLYFRATGGVAYHPGSKLRKMYTGITPFHMIGAYTFAKYDILDEYIKAAHELGMELYYWEPVFDTCGGYHWPKGSAWHDKFGEWPFRDESIPDELHWEHRFAKRPVQELERPVRKITLKLYNLPKVKLDQLVLMTAPRNADFKVYEKPYTVTVNPVDGPAPYKSEMVIDGLELENPVVKLYCKDYSMQVGVVPDTKGAISAEYDDGTSVDMFINGEILLFGDVAPELVRDGPGGFSFNWGGQCYNNPVSFIIRFGDFTRYAIGTPEYAYKQNRDRIRDYVAELYELHPDLDGVAFSIRTHTLPAGGGPTKIGAPITYGFCDPVVHEYIRRYGVNPREEKFDVNLFQKLHGESFTQMLGEVAEVVHAHGGKLECMAPMAGAGNIAHGSMYDWWGTANIDNFFDIRTWAQKGYVDNVIMIGTRYHQDTWDKPWKDNVRSFADHLRGTKTRLSLHVLVGGDPKHICTLLPQILQEAEIDEIEAYEEWEMIRLGHYGTYRKAVESSGRRIAGVDTPPLYPKQDVKK